MKIKSKLTQDKFAYLQLDFLVATLVFFIFVFSVYSQFDSRIDELDSQVDSLKLKGYARDICYMLVKTPGYPTNWEDYDVPDPKYLGLFNLTLGSLDSGKIADLSPSIFSRVLDNTDIEGFFRVEIIGTSTDTVYRDFGVLNQDLLSVFENYVCYSYYNDEIVRVVVGVWK